MQAPSREELAQSGSLEELYDKMAPVGIAPGWNKKVASLWPAPKKNFTPAHWKYEQARGALDAAGRLINTELAERRNLILFNPASGESYGTVRTMVTAYQMIMPGEWARAHRHTPNALRLILDSLWRMYSNKFTGDRDETCTCTCFHSVVSGSQLRPGTIRHEQSAGQESERSDLHPACRDA